jgi:hypothetical protein
MVKRNEKPKTFAMEFRIFFDELKARRAQTHKNGIKIVFKCTNKAASEAKAARIRVHLCGKKD